MSSSSGIWLNFHRDPTDRNTAICKICQKCLRMTTGTSNLSRHLNIHKRDDKEKVIHEPTDRKRGHCRCCLSEGNYRQMQATHRFKNGKPYSYILRTIFNITLAPIEVRNEEVTQLICGACELRLAESYDFYNTILESEDTLLERVFPNATIIKTEPTDSNEGTYLEQLLKGGKSTLDVIGADSLKPRHSKDNRLNAESVQTSDETAVRATAVKPIKLEPVETSEEVLKENAIITELEEVNQLGIKIESDINEEENYENEKTECETYLEIDKVEHDIDGPAHSGDNVINADLSNVNRIPNELTSKEQGLDEVAMACSSIMDLDTMGRSNLGIGSDPSDEDISRKRKMAEISEVEMACSSIMNLDDASDTYIQTDCVVDEEDCARRRKKDNYY